MVTHHVAAHSAFGVADGFERGSEIDRRAAEIAEPSERPISTTGTQEDAQNFWGREAIRTRVTCVSSSRIMKFAQTYLRPS
jgi:hypothetical protein